MRPSWFGENLGTVPPEVNAAMERHRLRSMFVLQFEVSPHPRQPTRLSPPNQVVEQLAEAAGAWLKVSGAELTLLNLEDFW